MKTNNHLYVPASALIVSGGILALTSLFWLILIHSYPHPGMSEYDASAEMMNQAMLKALLTLLQFIILVASGFAIYGGITMLKQGSYLWSMVGCISAIVGGVLQISPGIFLVMPVGIWALVVLRKSRGSEPKE